MKMQLPITEWVPYISNRYMCLIDPAWVNNFSWEECLHFRIHEATSSSPEWNDIGKRNVAINEVTAGVRENCRIAFNAAEVAEAWDNYLLVPRSSLIYLDSMVFYILGLRFNLKGKPTYVNVEFDLATEYHEQWLDANVYLRHIRGLHQTKYTMDEQVIQSLGGTPKYISRVEMESEI